MSCTICGSPFIGSHFGDCRTSENREWRDADANPRRFVPYTFHQNFWRCQHHPSCIDNYFEQRLMCEFDCHKSELRSTDSGFHQMPKSWGTPPQGSRGWAELQKNGL